MQEIELLVKQATDIISAQAPDFIKQFVVYSYLSALSWFVPSLVVLCFSISYGLKLKSRYKKITEEACFFQGLVIFFFFAVSLPISIVNLNNILLIHFAPKVFIAQHLASWLKGQ